ncbi:hypothetical protein HK100_005209 [Physocladia obscura]|uniref:STAS domain-containing protein n=1 Tax=Physocladia obscura TaxID=109957 RepID=A0AAD5T6P0_9FUNG|nr:hypothetical protein HK100_005209 [Physocladia obscura]
MADKYDTPEEGIKRRPRTHKEELKATAKNIAKDLPAFPARYLKSLFPIISWLPRYQFEWLWGDFIAGVTVGLVAIPQSISYATKLANLPAQFGLYTSFIGVLLYALFATSKDVTIGPTGVLSLATGQAIASYVGTSTTTQQVIFAATLAFWTGIIQLVVGLLRFGIVIDFVPIPVISGFTTGAGIQVIISQLPALLGIKGINTNGAPYQVLIDFFKAISTTTTYDTVFGLTSLVFILLIKFVTDYAVKRHGITWLKYVGFLRNTIVIIIYTGISYSLRDSKTVVFAIVKTIPYGFSGIQAPNLSLSYAPTVFSALPAIFIVSVLEHIAVVKTYGRVNGYTPNANQEIVAMGLANTFGSLIGAFPATGSFSRSAIKTASGVRSPLGSFVTGIVVVIGLFSLTTSLYYVPSAVLSAMVVASVAELVSKGKIAVDLIKVEILDFFGFFVGFIVTIFSSLENAIYASAGYSLLVLLFRIARPRVEILSRTAAGEWVDPESDEFVDGEPVPPLDSESPEGILVFKVQEALTYPNSGYILDVVKEVVIDRYRYTNTAVRKADKNWSDDTEARFNARQKDGLKPLPPLRAVVLDFSSVTNIDYTGFQILVDLKEDLGRYAGRPVPFHFAHVRRRHVNTLLGVPQAGNNANVSSATAAFEGERKQSLFKLKFKKTPEEKAEEEAREIAALEHFHKNIDLAVKAADVETKDIVFEGGLIEVVHVVA